jgi:carboxyl-terminal processing protease
MLVALLLVGAVRGRSASPDDAYKQLAVFTEVLSRIKSDYVEEPDLKSVTIGAINGLLESVDPYASYLNADQYKQYLKQKDLKRADVGLLLSRRFGYMGVVEVIPGTAAGKAGLNTGDMIEAISGVATRDMPLAFAELLLKGDAGTAVELMVRRIRRSESEKVSLSRAAVKYPAVTAQLLPDQSAWIALQTLEPGKIKEVADAIQSMEKQGAKRIVLDLRDCALGAPEEGIQLANLFVDSGVIATLEGQRTPKQVFEAQPGKRITKLPLALITNRGTASGSELAAAALLDSKRAEVVGERTYGDAAQRKAVTLEDGSAIILAVAKYHSPSGKAIQENAVTPSVPMADAPEPEASDDEAPVEPTEPKPRTADDAILKKAIEVLMNGKSKAAARADRERRAREA